MPVIGVICRPSGGIIVGIGVAIDFTDRLAAYCANVVTSTGFHTSRSGVNNPFTKSVSGIIRHRGAASVLTLVPVVGAICRPSDGIVVRGAIRGDCFALPFSARAGTLFDAVLGAGGRFRLHPITKGVSGFIRHRGAALILTGVPVIFVVACPIVGIIVRGAIRGDCFTFLFTAGADALFCAVRGASEFLCGSPLTKSVTGSGDGLALLLQASAASDPHTLLQARGFLCRLPLAICVGVLGVVGTVRGLAPVACSEGNNEDENERED